MEIPVPVLVVLAIVLIAVLLWLLFSNRGKRREETPVEPVVAARAYTMPDAVKPTVEDDLEIIEGIGPKIGATLKQAGVTTFAQLAAMDPARITEILRAGGVKLADPKSWPEQARLAANGDFEGLTALQERLTAGR